MKVFEYLLHYNLGYTVRIKRKELTFKKGAYFESSMTSVVMLSET